MTSHYVWIGLAVGLFFVGLGVGYAIFINTYNPYTMMGNPTVFNQMMSNPSMMNTWMNTMMQNPKFMNQWMSGMMSNPQFGQQYMGPWTMMQNPQYRGMMSQLNTQNFNASSHPAVDTNKISIVKDSWRTNMPESYSPTVAHVSAGTTVTWTNNDSIVHTVTDVNGLFDSGLIQPDTTWQYTFNTKGTVNYFCTIHPWMKGEVIVS